MSSGVRKWLAWAVCGLGVGLQGLALGLVAAMAPSLHRESFFGWPEELEFMRRWCSASRS